MSYTWSRSLGEFDSDGGRNITDFSILKSSFGKASGDPGYDDRADFTGDQVVSAPDFSLMGSNFGLGGAPPIGPEISIRPEP